MEHSLIWKFSRALCAIVLAHLVVTALTNSTWWEVIYEDGYGSYLFVSSCILYAILCYVSKVTSYLDDHFDWMLAPVKRTIVQSIFCILLPVLFFIVMLLLENYLMVEPKVIDQYLSRWIIVNGLLISVVLNLVYFIRYLYARSVEARALLEKEFPYFAEIKSIDRFPPDGKFVFARDGFRECMLTPYEIAYAFRAEGGNFVKTFYGQVFSIDLTLDELEFAFDKLDFFRINPDTFVSIRSCQAITTLPGGKLLLTVFPAHHETLFVTRRGAFEFRAWLKKPALAA